MNLTNLVKQTNKKKTQIIKLLDFSWKNYFHVIKIKLMAAVL